MQEIIIIAAMAENRVIGKNNVMPWSIKEEMAHFTKLTKGWPCIMGRKTWESLEKKPLPGRLNVVISGKLTEICQLCPQGVSSVPEIAALSPSTSTSSVPSEQPDQPTPQLCPQAVAPALSPNSSSVPEIAALSPSDSSVPSDQPKHQHQLCPQRVSSVPSEQPKQPKRQLCPQRVRSVPKIAALSPSSPITSSVPSEEPKQHHQLCPQGVAPALFPNSSSVPSDQPTHQHQLCPQAQAAQVKISPSLPAAIEHCANYEKVFICGGESIYRQALALANKIELTVIHNQYEGDTFFPEIDNTCWAITKTEDFDAFSFFTYTRIK
jgi:dihydrofolate reductase